MALPKVEGLLYLDVTELDVKMARPGWQSQVEVVGPMSVWGATCGALDAERVCDSSPPLSVSPNEQVGVKGGCEWVPVGVRVWAQNVVYATIRGNWWERSSQNVAWDVGENERGGCIKRSVGGA